MSQNTSLGHKLLTGQLSYEFVGRRRAYYIASIVMLLIAVAAMLVRGLEFGIEFRGGADFRAPVQVTDTTVDEVRRAITTSDVPDLGDSTVQAVGTSEVRVQTRPLDQNEVTAVRGVIAQAVGVNPADVTNSLIGPTWSGEVARQAFVALGVVLVMIAVLIAVYFRNWRMSLAAILALIHDIIVTLGVYALAGFTFTTATVIGLLTVLAYSLYDKVVVFDKVRENIAGRTWTPSTYERQANRAVNQVMTRSINTVITAVLPVASLLVFGLAGPLRDLGLVLLIGLIVGAYSSLFLATPLLVTMQGHRDHSDPATKDPKDPKDSQDADDDADGADAGADGSRAKHAVAMAEDGSALTLTESDDEAGSKRK